MLKFYVWNKIIEAHLLKVCMMLCCSLNLEQSDATTILLPRPLQHWPLVNWSHAIEHDDHQHGGTRTLKVAIRVRLRCKIVPAGKDFFMEM